MPGPPLAAGPLSGVVVLDLASVGPAARATRVLADYGAEVVKVGAPLASGAQIVPPPHAYSGHRFMRRVNVDLKDERGREVAERLVAKADVVVESFRPGVLDRLGLGYERLRSINPGIVLCSTTGFGQDGPRAAWAGHDVDYLAVAGYLAMSTPGEGGRPPLPGATVADAAAGGMQAAMAIMAALIGRERTGEGAHLDVSIADGALWLCSLPVDEHLATGTRPGPGGDLLSGRYACYGIYPTAPDEHGPGWLAVGAIEGKFFANLCRLLGCEQWTDRQMDDGPGVQDAIRSDLEAAFATRTRDEWVAELSGADTCVAPVLRVDEVAADGQYGARGAFVEAALSDGPDAGRSFRQVGAVLAGMSPLAEPVEVRDASVTDATALLGACGYGEDEITVLCEKGVVG